MTSNLEQNKALARREQEAFWAGGDAAIADELFAPQVTEGNGRVVSPSDLVAQMRMQRAAAPDAQIRVLDQVAEGGSGCHAAGGHRHATRRLAGHPADGQRLRHARAGDAPHR